MLILEKAKLEDMARYYATCNIADTDWTVARDAKICIKLINIISGEDSSYDVKYNQKNFDVIITKYVNIKNIKRFDESNYLSNAYKTNAIRYLIKDDLRIKKAWNLYCKIREYNMRDWWN